ncbi:hypothetical protein BGW36DRAFT_353487 [Talaromyces proteolyticus]|uniref:Pheromone-regulated membrane protein 6 n=1 Tax=Talaromyces proteolyticus TaxID=1131652 RepID=A0AAD4L1U3_9EURO|nr:uncharacterized protein BGW36DRAFT_353487 [Talaromyces proteolyticus]KAH8705060.1 hypothetical protein BGW36DRAFT_353487 [Talaromyces proteolyticus]
MGCCGDREKIGQMKLEQTWDYINLNDFKSSSCFTGFSYVMVWVFLIISVAVYAVDTFTAVNLLAFSRWSSQIKPKIPFNISRWIFAGCIIASFVLLIYRWIRAIRVMRSGSIAESYLDPLAVRVQSIRVFSQSKGYRRFLVFAELTKSKKGADYVALFSYFSFEAWLRIIFADGPRQVLNAITLYSVLQLNLIPEGNHAAPEGTSPVAQFFINIKALAEKNYQQAVILFGMLFTLVIWVFAALSLFVSVVLYLIFLWHHIPTEDGSLKRFCRRKINTRLDRIVRKKTAKALAKGGLQLKDRTPTMPLGEGEEMGPVKVAPTLPSLQEYPEDKKPIVTVAPLSRQQTQTTLPPYSSQTALVPAEEESHQQPTLPDLGDDSPWLTRTNTQNSAFDSTAEPMGYSPLDHKQSHAPPPPMPPMPFNPNQGRSYSPAMNRPPTAQGRPGPMTAESVGRRTPGPGYPQPPPSSMGRRTPGFGQDDYRNDMPLPSVPGGNESYDRPFSPANNRPYSPANNPSGRSLPLLNTTVPAPRTDPVNRSYTPGGGTASPRPQNNGGYTAFNPFASSTPGDARSQIPVSQTPVSRTPGPPTQPVIRPSTAAPTRNAPYQAHAPNLRATTTSPSHGYGRRPPRDQSHDEEEYDPLSYYGSA